MATTTLVPASSGLAPRELAHRRSGALEVVLLWRPAQDAVSVRVEDLASGVRIEIDVAHSSALEAFRHPFSYTP